jgi:hypothetical protein
MPTKEQLEFALGYPCPKECSGGARGCSFRARLSWTETKTNAKTTRSDIILELLKPEGSDNCKPGKWSLVFGPRNCYFDGEFNRQDKSLLLTPNSIGPPLVNIYKQLCDVDYWDGDFANDPTNGKPYKISLKPGWVVDHYLIDMELDCECLCKDGGASWTRRLKIHSVLSPV